MSLSQNLCLPFNSDKLPVFGCVLISLVLHYSVNLCFLTSLFPQSRLFPVRKQAITWDEKLDFVVIRVVFSLCSGWGNIFDCQRTGQENSDFVCPWFYSSSSQQIELCMLCNVLLLWYYFIDLERCMDTKATQIY